MAHDLEISVGIDASGTKTGAAAAKSEIKGIADEAERTQKRTRTASSAAAQDIKQIEKSAVEASKASSQMGSIIGTALTTIVAGAIAAVLAIVKLTTAYAEHVVGIGKMRTETLLSVQTLSALDMQLRRTHTSTDDFREGMKNLTKTIGDAANGSDTAVAKLIRLGIDPKKAITNLDGALKEILKKIVSLPTPVEQANAAMDAFGDSGYKLLPFIRSFNGDIDSLIKKAKELGVSLSEDDVRAAEEFQKSMADMEESVRSAGMTFAQEFMPIVKNVFDNFNRWLIDNKSSIHNWADDTANVLRGLIGSWNDLAKAKADYLSFGMLVGPGGVAMDQVGLWDAVTANPLMTGIRMLRDRGAKDKPIAPYQGLNAQPDDWAAAQQGLLPKAQSPYFIPPVPKTKKARAPKMTEEQKQAQELQRMIKDLNLQIEFFGDKSEVAATKQSLLRDGIDIVNNSMAKQAIGLAGLLDKKKADADADEKRKKLLEEYNKALQEIKNTGIDNRVNLGGDERQLTKELELGRDLNDVELQQIANQVELTQKRLEAQRAGFSDSQVEDLIAQLGYEQEITGEFVKRVQILKDQRAAQAAYKDLTTDLSAQLGELNEQYRTGADVTEVYRVQQELLKDVYKDLTPEERQRAIDLAAETDQMRAAIKAQEDMKRAYEDFRNSIRDSLQVLADEGFGGLFRDVKRKFKSFLLDMVSEWLTSKFFKMFYGGGNNQAAQQNGQQGGIFGGIFNGIFGKGQGGGTGPMGGADGNNPMIFHAAGSGNTGSMITLPNGEPAYNVDGSDGGSMGPLGGLGMTKNIFTGKEMSKNMQMASGIGALVALAGTMVKGRLGSVLSGAGTGLMIGAMFGGIGAIAGAAIGALIGLFKGGGQRKADEKTRNQGMIDSQAALKQFDSLINDVRALRIDPASGIAQGLSLGDQVRSNYLQMANSLKDKKTRNIALADVSRIDTIIAQKMGELRAVADVATAAGERERRMLPEFAGGVYMSPAFQAFRRYNGMLGGAWTGRDTIPAMIAHGEMVINPMQQQRVIASAGRDVFADAGIPGYAGGVAMQAPAMMEPEPIELYLSLQGPDANGLFEAAVTSPQGRKIFVRTVNDAHRNDEINTKRR
ncbi:MAG TPA: hypothetical protein VGO43_09690 [Pyrinomonadaceae bacterium]|jgi:hypothetical protein|nr:hypothetical protein [Pyrinomonadaceae bacterium]